MTMRLSVRWKKDRKLQFRLALFTGGKVKREVQGILDGYLSNAVSLLIKQRQHQTEELGAFLLPRDTYAKFSKAFQLGEWGGFYRIYSNFPIATKGPKTNLSSGKSQ